MLLQHMLRPLDKKSYEQPLSVSQYIEIEKWGNVTRDEWNNWYWQLKNTIKSPQELSEILLNASPYFRIADYQVLDKVTDSFEMKLNPYLIALIYHALKRGNREKANIFINAFVPTLGEIENINNGVDGIGEESSASKPAPLITNFYKNRVLFFVSNMCPAYCRYCFRRRKVGRQPHENSQEDLRPEYIQQSIQYIRNNKEIKEVIVSGGDPFILSDEKLLSILRELKEIEHVKVLRIDTKAFTTLPQRFTPEIIKELKELKPLYIVGNFLHSVELTPEVVNATSLFIDEGIPVVSHTALLKGINDNADVISELMWNLYMNRIIPYYLIQFIPTKWTEHFRVPIAKGLEIMKSLHGNLAGIANPTYIVYLPNGAGKAPLLPNYLIEHTNEGYYFENYEGKKVLYKEPPQL